MRDVCIIGAGIAGCACARYLAFYDMDVVVVDEAYDVSCGTTRANSGIVHAGYDPAPGTAKARYNVEGSRMYPELADELGFEFERCGSLVVAFSDEEIPTLEGLLERGVANGVEGLEILDADALHAKEPNLAPEAVAALWVPTGGIADPYGACLAFAENAADNGVAFSFLTRVERVERAGDAWRVHAVRTDAGDASVAEAIDIEARFVVNAAGLHAAELNNMVSAHAFAITPRVGEYLLLDSVWGDAFHSTVFQVPTAAGKGVLVSPTTGGNIIVGPNAVPRDDADATYTTPEGLDYVAAHARKTWKDLPARDAITNFAGLRASCVEDPDFHIGEPDDAPGFFNILGFDSPGLTAAPAVGKDIADAIATRMAAPRREGHDPHRAAPVDFSRLDDESRARLVAEDPAWGRIVCRCECVSEAEIAACVHSPVPARTTDAVKWRTRAGMGRCQGGFCLPLVAGIIARETGCDITEIRKGRPGSEHSFGHRGCFDDLPTVVLEGGRA